MAERKAKGTREPRENPSVWTFQPSKTLCACSVFTPSSQPMVPQARLTDNTFPTSPQPHCACVQIPFPGVCREGRWFLGHVKLQLPVMLPRWPCLSCLASLLLLSSYQLVRRVTDPDEESFYPGWVRHVAHQ